MSDLMTALTELRDARPAYEEAEAFYEGCVDEVFRSAQIERKLSGKADYRVNLARKPVQAVLDRLEIASFTCPDEGATKLLNDKFWEANELDIEAPEIHENGLSLGDAFLFVWPSDAGGTDADDNQDAIGHGVDAFYNSPLSVRVLYDEENPRLKKLAIKSWTWKDSDGKDRVRVNLYYADHFEKWVSKPGAKGDKEADFEPFLDDFTDADGHVPNPWGEVPFFHFRTRRPYGRPEHKEAYGPQNAITKLGAIQMDNADFANLPQRYGLIDGQAGTDDDLDWDQDDETAPQDRDSQLSSKPGSFWALRNYKSVGQFPAADPKNFLDPMGMYVRFMAATTTTPYRWFDPTGAIPSGESLRADDAPLVKKINARQRAFAATWRDAGQFALRILGITAVPTVRWKPPQIINDLEGWQAIREKQDAGVPIRTSLMEAGYTEAEVTSWGFTENEPNGPDGFLEEREAEVTP